MTSYLFRNFEYPVNTIDASIVIILIEKMLKPFCLIICFFLNIYSVCGQGGLNKDLSVYDQVVASAGDSIAKYKQLLSASHRAGDLETFKNYGEIILRIAETNNLKDDQISALVYLAIYYQQIDQYEESLSKYLEAEKMSTTLPKNSFSRILVQVNLGNLYNHIENYEKVKTSMKKVIELAAYQQNPDSFIISAYNSLGTANLNQGNYSEALEYMYKVKNLAEKMNRNDKIIGALINISECQRYLGQYDLAIDNSQKALDRIDEKESVELEASALVIMGISQYLLNQPIQALPNLKKARNISTDGNFLNIKMESHQYLAKTYEALDSLKKSLEEQKIYIKTREQYLKTLSKAQRLRVENESKTKSAIITEQQKSIIFLSREKQLYIFAGVVLMILLIVSSIIYRNKRRKLAEESLQLQGDKLLLKNENEALKDKLNALAQKIQKKETGTLKPKKSSLNIEEQQKYMELILNYMEDEKPFLDHDVKQSDIADNLKMSVHLLSEVLNVCFQKNFNNFINLYRVDTAKKLMKNPKYENYKILSIGYEAGFPSKTSFNRVFKNLVGLTPSEFQKQHFPAID
ncbi:helix-turn-helix domain-containing protein [Aquimarina mytili]|uniref:Tetratricopeptide repeat protein n=1 Tax=Aquimarina mytili TaxID=874423 RepID=A0A937D7D8_9FLAO|nr:helix-turn-helix domain-containing protein [Aquimarina mytili]MBL0685419.1 tetratricopeptide repeat protein [Aquimarina mytili]